MKRIVHYAQLPKSSNNLLRTGHYIKHAPVGQYVSTDQLATELATHECCKESLDCCSLNNLILSLTGVVSLIGGLAFFKIILTCLLACSSSLCRCAGVRIPLLLGSPSNIDWARLREPWGEEEVCAGCDKEETILTADRRMGEAEVSWLTDCRRSRLGGREV